MTKAEKKIARMLNSLGPNMRVETHSGDREPANYADATTVAKHLAKHGWRVEKEGES